MPRRRPPTCGCACASIVRPVETEGTLRAMAGSDDEAPRDQMSPRDRRPLTVESPGRAETYAQLKSPEDVPGGLYASYGAVTANALATAAAGKEPRRRAYMRRMLFIALMVGIAGSALVLALALLLE